MYRFSRRAVYNFELIFCAYSAKYQSIISVHFSNCQDDYINIDLLDDDFNIDDLFDDAKNEIVYVQSNEVFTSKHDLFLDAVIKGDISFLKEYLNERPNDIIEIVQSKDNYGLGVVHLAFWNRDNYTKVLQEKNDKVVNDIKITELDQIFKNETDILEILQFLAENGADMDMKTQRLQTGKTLD